MNLVFLYGPPAVGKLTVAKELSKLTGYKVFHNQLTVDLVEPIFEFGSKEFVQFADRYRLELLESAAKHNINLINTFVYAKSHDDPFVRKIVNIIRKHKGKICFARLYCSKKELMRRLRCPSRKHHRKIKKLKTLNEIMRRYNLFSNVPYKNNIAVNNTYLSPKETALKIKEHFRLS